MWIMSLMVYKKSDLILVAARPAMGKTAFTLNIAQNVTMLYDKTVAFFSLEMGKEQLVARILSSVAGVSSEKLRRAYNMDPTDWEKVIAAADRMSKAKLFIDDTPGLTVQDMRSKLRRLKVEHGLDLVIVDYIQLMQGRNSGKGSENRQQEVSEISRNLKLIAREFNVPLIALSQLSRGVEADQINGLYCLTFANLVPSNKMRISLSSCTAINITMKTLKKGTMQKSSFVNTVMVPSVPWNFDLLGN